MAPHISLVTLGVRDVAAATAFYERLGFKKSGASQEAVTFIQAGPVALGLFGRDALENDAKASGLWTGNGGITVAMNCASEAEVDAMMATAETAGAKILKPAEKTFWGGYGGYFADPDGHAWEVAYNPFWPLGSDGRLELPV